MIPHKIFIDKKVCSLLSKAIQTSNTVIPESRNQTIEDFRTQELPNSNIERDHTLSAPLLHSKQSKYVAAAGHLLNASTNTNAIVYPPMSVMKWHTNTNDPGIRTYYTYTEGKGIFRYYFDGQYYEDEDDLGWTARQFSITPEVPLWHTIWTEKHRYAFGFNTPFEHT